MKRILAVHFALFAVALIYATVFTVAKEAMPRYLGSSAMIVLRVGISMILFMIIHSIFFREKIQSSKHLVMLMVCTITGVGINMLLFFKGLSLTKPINGGVLMMFTPIFVVIFDSILNKGRITPLKVIGIIIACIGAIFLTGGDSFSFDKETLEGDIYITLNAIIYGYYLVYVKRLSHIYHPITISKWTFLFGTLFVLPFGWRELTNVDWENLPGYIWAIVAFIVVASTFLTYLLNAWALKYAPSSLVGAYIYLQPILTMLIAVLAGRDELTLPKVLFTLLIFAGVYMVSMHSVKPSEKL